jgi:hypothetical protein
MELGTTEEGALFRIVPGGISLLDNSSEEFAIDRLVAESAAAPDQGCTRRYS